MLGRTKGLSRPPSRSLYTPFLSFHGGPVYSRGTRGLHTNSNQQQPKPQQQHLCSSARALSTACAAIGNGHTTSSNNGGSSSSGSMAGAAPFMIPMGVLTDSYKASHFLQYPEARKMVAVSAIASPAGCVTVTWLYLHHPCSCGSNMGCEVDTAAGLLNYSQQLHSVLSGIYLGSRCCADCITHQQSLVSCLVGHNQPNNWQLLEHCTQQSAASVGLHHL